MNKKKCKIYKAKGFTLIEVIIAVSIVVILASLAVPKVTGYIGKAKDAKVANTSKQIFTAVMWSYSDQGNTVDTSKISDTITSTLSGVTVSEIKAVDNGVSVSFSSDNEPHSIVINTSSSSYTIN
jgi:type IV pilus assembly protein PilA